MSSETCGLELESPSATLPPAKWAVICTDEQFWDSRLHVWSQATALIPRQAPEPQSHLNYICSNII